MLENFSQIITSKISKKITASKSGLYAININARCGKKGDLRIEIDGRFFRETPPEKNIQKYDIPPAWNGTKLKGLSQVNIFLLYLDKGVHTLTLIPKESVQLESFDFQQILDVKNIKFNLELQAENGNGRPWVTVALIDLPLKSITPEASVDWHLFDGDDVKLIIDNEIEKNTVSLLWKNWLWHATPKQFLSGSKKEQKIVSKNLAKGIHYIEFWADKTPTLHSVILDLGYLELQSNPSQPNRIPTVDNPKWTKDFADDPDQIILARALFGEARSISVPDEARIAIGWVIKNRVESLKWPNTYWEVITTPYQFSCFNKNDPNRSFVENPLHKDNPLDKNAWEHAYKIAGEIMNGQEVDPAQGANHYYDDSIGTPPWAKDHKPTLTITYINDYKKEATLFFFKL